MQGHLKIFIIEIIEHKYKKNTLRYPSREQTKNVTKSLC